MNYVAHLVHNFNSNIYFTDFLAKLFVIKIYLSLCCVHILPPTPPVLQQPYKSGTPNKIQWDNTHMPNICSKHNLNLASVLSQWEFHMDANQYSASVRPTWMLITALKVQGDRGLNITSSRGRKLPSWRAMTRDTVSPCLVLLSMATSSS